MNGWKIDEMTMETTCETTRDTPSDWRPRPIRSARHACLVIAIVAVEAAFLAAVTAAAVMLWTL